MFILLLCRSAWSGNVWAAEPKSSTPTHGIFWNLYGSTWFLQGDVWKEEIALAEFTNSTVTFWCPAAISESMEGSGVQLRLGMAAEQSPSAELHCWSQVLQAASQFFLSIHYLHLGEMTHGVKVAAVDQVWCFQDPRMAPRSRAEHHVVATC